MINLKWIVLDWLKKKNRIYEKASLCTILTWTFCNTALQMSSLLIINYITSRRCNSVLHDMIIFSEDVGRAENIFHKLDSLHLSSFRDQLCTWHFSLWWCCLLLQFPWKWNLTMITFSLFSYFRHAGGSLVILSKNLAQYVNINRLVVNALTGKTGFGFNS